MTENRQPGSLVPAPVMIMLAGLGSLLLLTLAATFVGHLAIREAWSGHGPALLQHALGGRGQHPVGEYFARVDGLIRQADEVGLVLLLAFAVLSIRGVRDRFDRVVTQAAEPAPAPSAWPRIAAVTVTVFLVMQFLANATQIDLWPFSPYSMYSGLQRNPFDFIYLAAVTDSGEFRLDPATYVPPFDISRLPDATEALLETGDSSAMRRGLISLAGLYEHARRAGRHHGAPLLAARLYRVVWTIEPHAENRDHPDHKTLLAEYVVPR